MELGVRESARLLNVTEKTIYRWIKQGLLPAFRVRDQYRFNAAELLEWATTQRVAVAPEMLAELQDGVLSSGLADAVYAGGIFYDLEAADKPAMLRAAVNCLRFDRATDREMLLELLLAREGLGTTAVGRGIAVPHARSPLVIRIERPTMAICCFAAGVAFGAPDGEPVHTLITLLSPTVRAHLHLLARLTLALQQSEFIETLLRRGRPDAILAACEQVDQLTGAAGAPRERKDA